MCGIWAIFGSDGDVCEQSRCASSIAHRGPDAFRVENIHHYRNCCFVFYHLAIVDEVYGMQPMRIRSLPHISLVYNGEIYNYQKIQKEYGFEMLTKSDGESIIHLYNKFGMERAAATLDGVFAFCLLDTKTGKIYIGRDTYGVKPLYRVLRDDGFFAICSERKALYLLSNYIRENTDTVILISGDGSDEVAQGYSYFNQAPTAQEADAESRRLLEEIHQFDMVRTDRTTAAHGLELRVPFLDHYFTSYYLSIPPALRQPKDGVEKYLLRKAFQGTGLIPDDILWRPKQIFSDGIDSAKKPWFQYLQKHVETQVSDNMLNDASNRFPYNTPRTKEGYYYRQIFEKHYPGQASWTPNMWVSEWADNAADPS